MAWLTPGGRGVLPYKDLMGTCGQPSMFFGIFVLNRVLNLSLFVLNKINVSNRVLKNRNSVLNRVGKSAIFVLNRVRVWGATPHLPTQGYIEYPPGIYKLSECGFCFIQSTLFEASIWWKCCLIITIYSVYRLKIVITFWQDCSLKTMIFPELHIAANIIYQFPLFLWGDQLLGWFSLKKEIEPVLPVLR